MPINSERLAATFVQLCEIDSPSRHEKRLADHLKEIFRAEFKLEALEDDSAIHTGSDSGNLLIRFSAHGESAGPAVFFNCHLDTVEPARGVRVRRQGDTFYSAGPTILGADDKAGIAMLIEMARVVKEDGAGHPPFEFLFTTCEEIGLLGAKHLDRRLFQSRMGYALDSADIDLAVVGAPAANHFSATVHGLAAHAGLHPENGISAIKIAAEALTAIRLGRLDPESTANVGRIVGGGATNIVPAEVRVEGEVRSHCEEKLKDHTAAIAAAFHAAVARHRRHGREGENAPPWLEFQVVRQFPAMHLTEQDLVVRHLSSAAARLGRRLNFTVAGGGSDANIFNGYGLPTIILGIGMTDVHTTDESVRLSDLVRTTELLVSLLTS